MTDRSLYPNDTVQLVRDFVADLPLPVVTCSFNVLRKQGKHRQCNKYARVIIDSYPFCKRHAEIVKKETQR